MARNQATGRENSAELREYLTLREYEAKVLLVTHVPLRALTVITETRVTQCICGPQLVYQRLCFLIRIKKVAIFIQFDPIHLSINRSLDV